MALKALLLRKRIDSKKKELSELSKTDADLEKREAELAAAIEEVTDETPAEQRDEITEMVTAFDADKAAHEEKKSGLAREIEGLEAELANEEAVQENPAPVEEKIERKEVLPMLTRAFDKMTVAERTAIVERSDVQDYLTNVRTAIKEKRAISNVGLTIPEVLLGLLRENVLNYSKLYRHVTVRTLRGDGRYLIMGTVPEAIWTECCANLNELSLAFNDIEFNCYMVAGYFAVCNANIEDSDIDLVGELLDALGQALGRALDKAILYGRNAAGAQRMPLGIITRLAQTSQPADYPATARPWRDLHTSNLRAISAATTGKALFTALAVAASYAKGRYARGEKVWLMNESTYSKIVSEAAEVDMNGAIVSAINGNMPVAGGIIEVLDFIPDNTIIVGYFDLYVLAERRGPQFATSEHVRFLQNQTVLKGTARYDGAPAIAEAFVGIAIGDSAPTANAVAFDPDAANVVAGILIPATANVVVGDDLQLPATLMPFGVEAALTWSSATTGKVTVNSSGVVHGVATGTSVVTVTGGGQTATCSVTCVAAS